MSTEFSIFADGQPRPLEPEVADELARRLARLGISRRNSWTGELVERSAAGDTASRIQAAITAGESNFVPTDEDKSSLLWALREWLDGVGVDKFPPSAMALRYALVAEAKSPGDQV